MDILFSNKNLKWDGILIPMHIDDVLVATKSSYKECILNLEQVFEKLDTANLCKNIKKCNFATQEFE
jgi:hypothetical protein